jgi:hypothetical protein
VRDRNGCGDADRHDDVRLAVEVLDVDDGHCRRLHDSDVDGVDDEQDQVAQRLKEGEGMCIYGTIDVYVVNNYVVLVPSIYPLSPRPPLCLDTMYPSISGVVRSKLPYYS